MTTTEPTTPDEGDKGDGPASNETSGQFPADDVNDAPSSYTTVGPADHEPATVDAPDPPDDEGDKG